MRLSALKLGKHFKQNSANIRRREFCKENVRLSALKRGKLFKQNVIINYCASQPRAN